MDKIKNLSALRIVAFAVSIAIILGFSSLMFAFSACAESTNDIPTITQYDKDITVGTLKNYPCLQLSYSSEIDYLRFRNLYYQSGSHYMFYTIFGVDSSDKLVDLASFIGSEYTYNNYTGYKLLNITDGYYTDKVYKFKFCFSESSSIPSINFNSYRASFDSEVFTPYGTHFSFDKSLYSKLYLVYKGTSDNSNESLNRFVSDVSNNINGTDFKEFTPPPTGGSENGRFISFGNYKEYSYDVHLADISAGAVYQRNDYLASEQTNYTAFMFDDTTCFNWADERVKSGHIVMYPSTSIAFNYYNSSDSVGAVKLRVSKTQMFPSLRESDNPFDVTHYFVMKPANKHFSRYVIISDGSLRSVPPKSTASFRVNMQGYCNMDFNSYYLCEIVDVQTDTVISSAMFVYTGKNSGKIDGSNIKDGKFISVDYEYQDGNNVNDGSLTPDEDGTLPNLPNGIKDETFNPTGNYNLSNLDISDIFSSLNQATASIGAFFQATLNIIPITIMTLIIGSLALLIVLRILGR